MAALGKRYAILIMRCQGKITSPRSTYLLAWMKVVFLKVETKYKEQQALYMCAIIDRFSQSYKACIIMLVKEVLQQLMELAKTSHGFIGSKHFT